MITGAENSLKILLTNDDGWDAPGLQMLHSVAAQYGDVWIVAPLLPMSGISHQTTFERPLTLTEKAPQIFSLDGTPADCVRIATTQLDIEFDWVLSGINNGGNLGSDIFVSGTVAAAREAALRGVKSISLSQHRKKFKAEFDWTKTGWMASAALDRLLTDADSVKPRTVLNVNFPDRFHADEVTALLTADWSEAKCRQSIELVHCNLDPNPLPADFVVDEVGRFLYCSKYNDRARQRGCDIDVCFGGAVAISMLRF